MTKFSVITPCVIVSLFQGSLQISDEASNAAWCSNPEDNCLSSTHQENLKICKEQNYLSLQFISWKGEPSYILGNLCGIKMMLNSFHFPL
jgi:hypothetical protein